MDFQCNMKMASEVWRQFYMIFHFENEEIHCRTSDKLFNNYYNPQNKKKNMTREHPLSLSCP